MQSNGMILFRLISLDPFDSFSIREIILAKKLYIYIILDIHIDIHLQQKDALIFFIILTTIFL